MKPKEIFFSEIESKIFLIQGEKVLLDSDLAELYQIPTKRLKEQVKRNAKRFPRDFMFVLSNQDFAILRSQFATSRFAWGGIRIPPMVFTEQGVAMLSSVLNSDRAIDVNIAIMRTFVKLREVLNSNQEFEKKLNELEAWSVACRQRKFKLDHLTSSSVREIFHPALLSRFSRSTERLSALSLPYVS